MIAAPLNPRPDPCTSSCGARTRAVDQRVGDDHVANVDHHRQSPSACAYPPPPGATRCRRIQATRTASRSQPPSGTWSPRAGPAPPRPAYPAPSCRGTTSRRLPEDPQASASRIALRSVVDASSGLPAPTFRAMIAVEPTPTAIIPACENQKIWPASRTPASASSPRWPTSAVSTSCTIEKLTCCTTTGHASRITEPRRFDSSIAPEGAAATSAASVDMVTFHPKPWGHVRPIMANET